MSGAAIHFTDAQAAKLREVLASFVDSAAKKEAPGTFLILLSGIGRILADEDNIGQTEIDLLVWMLEVYFESFDEQDIDPLAEQAYHKLTGYWYEGFAPWYERMKALPHPDHLSETTRT